MSYFYTYKKIENYPIKQYSEQFNPITRQQVRNYNNSNVMINEEEEKYSKKRNLSGNYKDEKYLKQVEKEKEIQKKIFLENIYDMIRIVFGEIEDFIAKREAKNPLAKSLISNKMRVFKNSEKESEELLLRKIIFNFDNIVSQYECFKKSYPKDFLSFLKDLEKYKSIFKKKRNNLLNGEDKIIWEQFDSLLTKDEVIWLLEKKIDIASYFEKGLLPLFNSIKKNSFENKLGNFFFYLIQLDMNTQATNFVQNIANSKEICYQKNKALRNDYEKNPYKKPNLVSEKDFYGYSNYY